MKNNQIIIIGGGFSINDLIKQGLWNKLKNTLTLGINFSFRDYKPTALCCSDYKFYIGEVAQGWKVSPKGNRGWCNHIYDPKFRKELESLPLIIAPSRKDIKSALLPDGTSAQMSNTIWLPYVTAHQFYNKRDGKKGIFSIDLAGIWTLGVACKLLTDGDIFLLGFDWKDIRGKTHYYEHTNHRGIGLTTKYDKDNPDYYFKYFTKNYPNLNIYNLSLDSKIITFPKIPPAVFFDKIKELPISQEALRKSIIQKLNSR